MAFRFRPDLPGIREVLRDERVTAYVAEVAEGMASAVALAAPKDTGAGAASIQGRPDREQDFTVSWDGDHYYMIFQEDRLHFLEDTYASYVHR